MTVYVKCLLQTWHMVNMQKVTAVLLFYYYYFLKRGVGGALLVDRVRGR